MVRCLVLDFYGVNVSLPTVAGGPNVRFRCHEEFGDRREDVVTARTYFYEDEAQCDTNMLNIMRSIDAVSGRLLCSLVVESVGVSVFQAVQRCFKDCSK